MATYKGTQNDDVIVALGSGSNILRGLAGDDVLHVGFSFDPANTFTQLKGGSGSDLFFFEVSSGLFFDDEGNPITSPSTGSVVVKDFVQGQDKVGFYEESNNATFGLSEFDSNHDGLLTSDDDWVTVENATVGGATKLSTILDTSFSSGSMAPNSVTLFGVSGLTPADGVAVGLAVDENGSTRLDYDSDGVPDPATSVVIAGTSASETLRGSGFDDRISGGGGNDIINGLDGDDILRGQGGNDRIFGDAGADSLVGGTGDDLLDGGAGDDQLQGGGGSDVFLTSYGGSSVDAGSDVYIKFTEGKDQIGLDALFHAGQQFDGGDLFAFLDSNNDGLLTSADEHVEVADATVDGATKMSTFIEIGAFADFAAGASGPWSDDTVLVFGTTGLQSGDFQAVQS